MFKLVGHETGRNLLLTRGTEVHDQDRHTNVDGDLLLHNAINIHLLWIQVVSADSYDLSPEMADLRFDNQTVVVTGAGGG